MRVTGLGVFREAAEIGLFARQGKPPAAKNLRRRLAGASGAVGNAQFTVGVAVAVGFRWKNDLAVVAELSSVGRPDAVAGSPARL